MSDAVLVSIIGGGVTVIVTLIGVVIPYLRLKYAAQAQAAPALPDPPDDDRYVLTTLGNHEARIKALENAHRTPQEPAGGP